jgi:hypothetical protein
MVKPSQQAIIAAIRAAQGDMAARDYCHQTGRYYPSGDPMDPNDFCSQIGQPSVTPFFTLVSSFGRYLLNPLRDIHQMMRKNLMRKNLTRKSLMRKDWMRYNLHRCPMADQSIQRIENQAMEAVTLKSPPPTMSQRNILPKRLLL